MSITHSHTNARAPVLDGARGIAVLAMIIYHFAWDLSHFGLIDTNVATAGGWKLFAQAIAASFLFISGVSLHLASAGGLNRAAFLRRLLLISAAAGLVTAGTYAVFPHSYVTFGILHCIAVSSLVAVALRSLPPAVIAVIGIAVLILPSGFRGPAFEAPWIQWLGLGAQPPRANDFVPVFPWTGYVLLGLAAGRAFGARLPRTTAPRSGLVGLIGRHSLPIYLVHQPVLFGALALGIQMGVLPDRQAETALTRTCAMECQVSGASPSLCSAACLCTTQELRRLPLWRHVIADTLSFEDRRRVDAIGQACYRESARHQPASRP